MKAVTDQVWALRESAVKIRNGRSRSLSSEERCAIANVFEALAEAADQGVADPNYCGLLGLVEAGR